MHTEQRRDDGAVLEIGRRYDQSDQQAEGIDRRMTFLPFNFLACVISSRINVLPPFSALLTLWLSTMASVGEGFLPASSRHLV